MRADFLDWIADTLDNMLLAGEVESVGKILSSAATNWNDELPVSAYLTMIVITLPWRKGLAGPRRELADAIRTHAPDLETTITEMV